MNFYSLIKDQELLKEVIGVQMYDGIQKITELAKDSGLDLSPENVTAQARILKSGHNSEEKTIAAKVLRAQQDALRRGDLDIE